MKPPTRPVRWGAGAAAAVAAAVTAVALTGGGDGSRIPVRARQYTARQACLLTDQQGITTPRAATVWAGMEDASLATHAKVAYLPVYGPATTADAVPYADGLLARHCDVLVAVGTQQTGALAQLAPSHPATHFVLVGGAGRAGSKNLTTLAYDGSTRDRVARTVEALVGN